MSILAQTELDVHAESIHSGYGYDTNCKLDTLFGNWTFLDMVAAEWDYERADRNGRADEAYAVYELAKGEAELETLSQQRINELFQQEVELVTA